MKIYEIEEDLPSDVVAAFHHLGEMQRGEPERLMVKLQFIYGGGVLNPLIEHVGDITHRMTRMSGLKSYGLEAAEDKILKTYKWLNHPYGFEKEMDQNIINNADYKNIDPNLLRRQIDIGLKAYGNAHAKIPVYNRAQYDARETAVCIGNKDFDNARNYLLKLVNLVKSGKFEESAMSFKRDANGKLMTYPYKTS